MNQNNPQKTIRIFTINSLKSFLQRVFDEFKLDQCIHRGFYVVLIIKGLLVLLTTPPLLTDFFIPFIQEFVSNPFANPYESFLSSGGRVDAFPYSSIMLWFYAAPLAVLQSIFHFEPNTLESLSYILPRLSILAADVVCYVSLAILLPVKRKSFYFLWWLNPIVWYVCYIHSQLDILPTAALLLALVGLFHGRDMWAFMILGLGLSMKSHLFAALPMFALYVYFKTFSKVRPIKLCLIAVTIFALCQLPYYGQSYLEMVIFERKSAGLFQLGFPYDHLGRVLFAPAAIFFVFIRFAVSRSATRDTFMLYLGLLYTLMVTFVAPSPGWFLWCLPFLVYFFAKFRNAPRIILWSTIVSFFVFYSLQPHTDLISSFTKTSIDLFQFLEARSFDVKVLNDLAFTALMASLALNALWIYRTGVSSSQLSKLLKKNFRIGISGDSGSGKSTLTTAIVDLFGKRNTTVIAGDDLHKWERGNDNWKRSTHLDPKSNRLSVDVEHAELMTAGRTIQRSMYDHKTGTFTKQITVPANSFIIFQGLHTFFLPRMRNLMNLKIFMQPEKDLRYVWKIKRDMAKRQYSMEKVLEQLQAREKDSEKFIDSQRHHADIVVSPTIDLPDPKPSLQDLLAMDHLPLKLQVITTLDFNVEKFCHAFSAIASVRLDYWYDTETNKIVFDIFGTISDDDVAKAASHLTTFLAELTGHDPIWHNGHDGMIQLFMIAYLDQFYHKDLALE